MREIATWMGIVGIPSMFAIIAAIVKSFLKYANKIQILCQAQQAQMRAQLLDLYHIYKDRGWISEEELEEWDNQYQAYHSLGKNGVLDKRRDELLKMPSAAPKKRRRPF